MPTAPAWHISAPRPQCCGGVGGGELAHLLVQLRQLKNGGVALLVRVPLRGYAGSSTKS